MSSGDAAGKRISSYFGFQMNTPRVCHSTTVVALATTSP